MMKHVHGVGTREDEVVSRQTITCREITKVVPRRGRVRMLRQQQVGG